ncbi:unnamed protein product [Phytomonas sp. EM1]|nr:unnamed protein product [Phytomonas sp. EM1]|eukprot:CCW63334.1 unnamed protein product [Phytomonas sp. isolate EM1]
MRQQTLFDSFESAKKNAVGRERKRSRDDDELVESSLGFSGKMESSPTEQVVPPHFFLLCGTEYNKKVGCLWREREERIRFLQHQNTQTNLQWSHFHRNEDENAGENSIISPAFAQNVYKNSIIDISTDSSGQVFFALQRSGFNLLSSSFVHDDSESSISKSLILRLDSNIICEHRQTHQRRPFIFSCSQFMGNSLFLACGYSGTSILEIFDLEDVDETTCDPVCSFRLNEIQRSQEVNNLFLEEDTPFATDIVSLSDNLSASGLSNGESAWIDLRQKVVIQCTPRIGTRSKAPGLLDMRSVLQRPSSLSSIVFSSSNSSLLITGAKDGRVSLWDVRYSKDFIASYRSGSEIGRLWTYTGNGKRMGCPQIWFNNYRGNIVGLAVGSDSFSEIFSLKTEDSMRDDFSNNIATPKLALSDEGLVFYPHISKNCILALDIEFGIRGFFNEEIEPASLEKPVSYLADISQNVNSHFVDNSCINLHNIVGSKALRATFSFSDTSGQISACSVIGDQLFLLAGGSVGGLCLIQKGHTH